MRKNAWYKKLGTAGVAMFAWPVARQQLPGWIQQRAQNRGVQLARDAAQLLAELTEGNLLACAQEIDRLALLHGTATVTAADVAAAASDQARFGMFDLPAKAIAGDGARALQSLSRLQEAGVEEVPILWALVRETRLLCRAAVAARAGRLDAMLRSLFMRPKRKQQLSRAARRADPRTL